MTRALHLLYGNAAGPDGSGYRVIRRPESWAEAADQSAEAWLRQLQPAAGGEGPGLATAAFRVGEQLYACLARVEADFGTDAYGRQGAQLHHLLALPVEEGRDVGLHAAALVDLAQQLQRPPGEEPLAAYLEQLVWLPEVEVPPPHLAGLRGFVNSALPPFLRLAAAAASQTSPAAPVPSLALHPPPGRCLAEVLAMLSGALPPRLRLALRWGAGVEGQGVHVLGTITQATPAPAHPAADDYADWLRERLEASRFAPVQAVLASWQLRSWNDLLDAIEER